ncbi:hypothetical protein BIZ37_03555 [Photobacterium sp. BZF1]|uniref:hypothetical protein n=1 Tax=Photobacterium sp. BZF1 TaxID=1904457 RepID=UPI0016537151|nr:hypothetical protein [Photobacterium sp. BZF1]MBC7001625.1 hypothetical protein [Photobacterium sp. BZF1]
MSELLAIAVNMRKCLAWLVVIDYILIFFYVFVVGSLLYVELFLIGVLIAVYNFLLVTILVHQPPGFLTFSRDKHLIIPICFAAFLGCVIVVCTLFL